MAGDRSHADEAYAGDIIGLHNHGTIQIGDTFTQAKSLNLPVFQTLRLNYSVVFV